MTTLQEATLALFTGDAAMVALATGGIYDAETLGRTELTLDDIRVSGSPTINPALFVRWSTEAPFSAVILKARSVFVELYCYQDGGYDITRQMRNRAYELMHQQNVIFDEPSSDYLYAYVWAGDLTGKDDDSLQGASMERSRFEGHLIKE